MYDEIRKVSAKAIFDKAYNHATHIDHDGKPCDMIDVNIELDGSVAYTDYKDRRVIVFDTELGNVALIEEKTFVPQPNITLQGIKTLSNSVVYSVLYKTPSPLIHLLPFKVVDYRDVLYICGDGDEILNISERVSDLIFDIAEYAEVLQA